MRVVNQSDVKQKFFNTGTQTVGSSPAQFAAVIKSKLTRIGKLIREAGIRAD